MPFMILLIWFMLLFFIQRSMMVGILHEGTTTSFFSETWVLTKNVLLQHPSVQITGKLLSKSLSIPEYKKVEISMVDSNRVCMLLSQSLGLCNISDFVQGMWGLSSSNRWYVRGNHRDADSNWIVTTTSHESRITPQFLPCTICPCLYHILH